MQRVLIIDDKLHLLRLLELRLQQEGLTVLTAHSGAEGLSLASRCKPDLVVVDSLIAEAQGEGFVRRLSQTGAEATIPVILLSARGDDLLEEDAASLAQVRKPFRPSQLIALVREHL